MRPQLSQGGNCTACLSLPLSLTAHLGVLSSGVSVWEATCGGLSLFLNFLFGNGSQEAAKVVDRVPWTCHPISSILPATVAKAGPHIGTIQTFH